jgi:nucleotide-binding universal stress UspA family protein
MIDIKRILCPIDYSDFARRALDHAVVIAKWYGATVTLFHVSSMVPVMAYAPAGPVLPQVVLTPEDRAPMLAALRTFAESETGSTVPLAFDIGQGNVAAEILAKATAMSADLLVLGTHGLSGFDRLVLGSVTEKVLRKAACPVLTVPSHAPDVVPLPSALFRRILCAVDFSSCSIHGLEYAISLAEEADARLTVLNVLDVHPQASPTFDEAAVGLPPGVREYVARVEEEHRIRLRDLVPVNARPYCTIDTVLAKGTPYREILRVAAEEKSDLIVIGIRGRGAADVLLFGSTTQHVVRQAACPVLTLRRC